MGRPASIIAQVAVGSLVYLKSEKNKLQARHQYIVSSMDKDSCTIRKFVSGQYRAKQYLVKLPDIFPVIGAISGPTETIKTHHEYESDNESSDSEIYDECQASDGHSTDSSLDMDDNFNAL